MSLSPRTLPWEQAACRLSRRRVSGRVTLCAPVAWGIRSPIERAAGRDAAAQTAGVRCRAAGHPEGSSVTERPSARVGQRKGAMLGLFRTFPLLRLARLTGGMPAWEGLPFWGSSAWETCWKGSLRGQPEKNYGGQTWLGEATPAGLPGR